MNPLHRISSFFIRTLAFLGKEVFEVLRQPRLILSLIVGPFLILLLVGIGYRNQARPLRTLFVAQSGSLMATEISQYAQNFGPGLIFAGVTDNQQDALDRLKRGEVDLVAVAPVDPANTIRNNQQAIFTLYHNEIDPFQVSYVDYFGQVSVDEMNRVVLRNMAKQGQTDAADMQQTVQAMRDNARQAREALQRSDIATARTQQRQLSSNLSIVELAMGGTLSLLSSVDQLGATTQTTSTTHNSTDALRSLLVDLRNDTNATNDMQSGQDSSADIQKLQSIETRLDTLDSNLKGFRQINPDILVRPFGAKSASILTIQPRLSDYFAPAVVVLLLQHLAVTFAALSLVRDRQLGTLELFRASPLSALETLLGKYLSYLLFGGVLAIILTLLVRFGLGVPMLGAWSDYVAVVAALLFTSLGVGFFISLLSFTDSQAVQFAMIVLLASVFFSGMFLALTAFWEPVRLISWLLPATYATSLLQNIMLRGQAPGALLLAGLTVFGMLLFIVNLILLHRTMAKV
jgi:ABC-2 type transport system permease protein